MKTKSGISSESKVIAAAIDEFAEKGYAGARVDSIAERAKINKAMIYYHFKSKEILYERILKDITDDIFRQVQEAAVTEGDPVEVFYSIIKRYISMLNSFDRKVFQIMLREIASGADHFRKIAIPNLAVPIISLIQPLMMSAIEKKRMRDVNPYYTFLQVIGGIIFFNIIRIPMEGSVLEKTVFGEGYLDGYTENLFKILRSGIELKDGNL